MARTGKLTVEVTGIPEVARRIAELEAKLKDETERLIDEVARRRKAEAERDRLKEVIRRYRRRCFDALNKADTK